MIILGSRLRERRHSALRAHLGHLTCRRGTSSPGKMHLLRELPDGSRGIQPVFPECALSEQ